MMFNWLFSVFLSLQTLVCGSPEIPLDLLKSVASYKGVESTSALVSWFWEVMEEFSNHERSLFLRFVWGRTRLPRTIADFRGRDFVLQVLDKYQPPDYFLPESYTCFFLLKIPRYSSKVSPFMMQSDRSKIILIHSITLWFAGHSSRKTQVCHCVLQEHRHRWICPCRIGRTDRSNGIGKSQWHWIWGQRGSLKQYARVDLCYQT